ncbi:hypothetical protein ACTI_45230 [Actinoplanes sp. OR16]|uniref:hypothetical protein n=1 Tax=Actinoplanes sp. OR16 TaxID=946334 RepID=UPI000F6BC1B5|nr:hypothetical protein [Actinoplanes sp. OR16]BBH67838.1 hypothetical protein ACTI_45230 [Actinoplanes sp. OR16]
MTEIALPRREPYRTWPGALIVLAVIIAYVGTLVVIDDETAPDLDPVPANGQIRVGSDVVFAAKRGWYVDVTDATETSVSVVDAGAGFNVTVSDWDGTLADEVRRQKSLDEAFSKARLLGDDTSFSIPGGLEGTTFSYLIDQSQGRGWISVDEQADRAIVVYGHAPIEVFQQALPDFQDMLDSIRTEAKP